MLVPMLALCFSLSFAALLLTTAVRLLLLAMFEPAGQEKAASPHIDVELILRTLHVGPVQGTPKEASKQTGPQEGFHVIADPCLARLFR